MARQMLDHRRDPGRKETLAGGPAQGGHDLGIGGEGAVADDLMGAGKPEIQGGGADRIDAGGNQLAGDEPGVEPPAPPRRPDPDRELASGPAPGRPPRGALGAGPARPPDPQDRRILTADRLCSASTGPSWAGIPHGRSEARGIGLQRSRTLTIELRPGAAEDRRQRCHGSVQNLISGLYQAGLTLGLELGAISRAAFLS
jgi:hypothetical protein